MSLEAYLHARDEDMNAMLEAAKTPRQRGYLEHVIGLEDLMIARFHRDVEGIAPRAPRWKFKMFSGWANRGWTIPAPPPIEFPRDGDLGELRRRARRNHERFQSELPPHAASAIVIHPLFGDMTGEELAMMMASHARYHRRRPPFSLN